MADEWHDSYTALEHVSGNHRLAQAIRKVNELYKASSIKDYHTCINEIVGNDPIAIILGCLFPMEYGDMLEFADKVLGKDGNQ